MLRYLPIVLSVACVSALLMLYGQMQPVRPAADAPAQTHQLLLRLRDGERIAGPAAIETTVGDTLELDIVSDQALTLHLHGYDRLLPVQPDAPGRLVVALEHSGRFGLERHGDNDLHSSLMVITVYPR
ncbi:MAG: hypothetical protein ABF296_11325 [Oceanococcaceae bacterium]